MARLSEPSPYVEFDRAQWRELRKSTRLALTEEELTGLRGLGEQIDLAEVAEVYLPLARLIHLQVAARQRLFAATDEFLGEQHQPDAAGAVRHRRRRQCRGRASPRPRACCRRCWPAGNTTRGWTWSPPTASCTPTPNCTRRNIMHRKGFPDSYNRRELMRFVTDGEIGRRQGVRAGLLASAVRHRARRDARWSGSPTSSILEGLNVLQTGPTLMVSDLFDFSLYVDARIEDIEQWYVSRFLAMRSTAFADPASHFHHYATLTDQQAVTAAQEIWRRSTGPT